MSDILARIAAYKREEVAARRAEVDPTRMGDLAAAADPPRGFRRRLIEAARPGRPALIAEIKKASPSKGLIREDFDPPSLARAYAKGGAACLSVLTDGPSFMGSEAALRDARSGVSLPVLRKDFMIDPWQVVEARAMGADAILVIMALTPGPLAAELIETARRLGMDALVEVHDEAEMDDAAALNADLIGVNNRDLRTFVTRLDLTARLAGRAPPAALLVSESGIFTPEDVALVSAAGAQAILVGESLMRQSDVEAAVRSLLGG